MIANDTVRVITGYARRNGPGSTSPGVKIAILIPAYKIYAVVA